jgi:hypothetical protein
MCVRQYVAVTARTRHHPCMHCSNVHTKLVCLSVCLSVRARAAQATLNQARTPTRHQSGQCRPYLRLVHLLLIVIVRHGCRVC